MIMFSLSVNSSSIKIDKLEKSMKKLVLISKSTRQPYMTFETRIGGNKGSEISILNSIWICITRDRKDPQQQNKLLYCLSGRFLRVWGGAQMIS